VDVAADDLRSILKLALTTGLRQGEIFKAKWKDANLQLGTFRVPEENAKSKKERIVPVDPDLCVGLKIGLKSTRIIALPEWRNWQTRWTQNPVDRKARVGSIPSSGNYIFPIFSLKISK
jgi:integrase